MSDILQPRRITPPWCWQSQTAMDQIDGTYDNDSQARLASSAYVALTRIASARHAEVFECGVADVARQMRYTYNRARAGLRLAEAAGVIHVERRKVAGTQENAPSIYTLLQVGQNLPNVGQKLPKVRQNSDSKIAEIDNKRNKRNKKKRGDIVAAQLTTAPTSVNAVDPQSSASPIAKEIRHGKNDSIVGVAAAWSAEPNLPRIRNLSDKRKKTIAARLKDTFFAEHYGAAIAKVAASAFCRGENKRHWRADIDWFLRPDSVTRIMEGAYDDGTTGGDLPTNLVTPEPGRPTVDDVNRAAWERKLAERAVREAAEAEHSP